VKIQSFDCADLAIAIFIVLGIVASIAMLVSGAGLEAVITWCVIVLAGIAQSYRNKEPSDNAQRNITPKA
jgi:hypothetical protein